MSSPTRKRWLYQSLRDSVNQDKGFALVQTVDGHVSLTVSMWKRGETEIYMRPATANELVALLGGDRQTPKQVFLIRYLDEPVWITVGPTQLVRRFFREIPCCRLLVVSEECTELDIFVPEVVAGKIHRALKEAAGSVS